MPHVPGVGRLSTADLGNLAGEPDTPLSSKTREWCLLHGCALTLLSLWRSKTAAGESELPGQPEMGLVRHSCSRESVGMEDPLASVFIVATELTHSLGHNDAFHHIVSGFLETLELRAAYSHHTDTLSPPAWRLRGRQVPHPRSPSRCFHLMLSQEEPEVLCNCACASRQDAETLTVRFPAALWSPLAWTQVAA